MNVRFDSTPLRDRSLERLGSETFDVLVIGAGIVGARIAYEAAGVGLRVALVDAGDFGGATSSASGRLIHGGMRYLHTGSLRLVRQAQRERRVLVRRVAPHLVRPLPMLLADGRRELSPRLAAGLIAYAALDGFRRPVHRFASSKEVRTLVPPLSAAGPCILLNEAQSDDHRLTLATVKAAARAGAVAANYLRVVDFERSGGGISGVLLRGRPEEGFITARCRALINATGPWMDHLRRLEDPESVPLTRLSKGVHLVLPRREEWRAAAARLVGNARAVYAVPVQGMLLIGTTDTLYEGDPAEAAPEPGDVAALLDAASHLLPPELVREDFIRHSFAGLRVLPSGGGETARASREHVTSVGPGGMVSVGGGKLTTHRLIALDALRLLPAGLRPKRLLPSDEPLPGAGPADISALRERLDTATVEHLIRLYGSEANELLDYTIPDALERIHPDAPDIRAQAYHAVAGEWAITAEDILRRTTLGIRGLTADEVRSRLGRFQPVISH